MSWIVYHPQTAEVLRIENISPDQDPALGYFFDAAVTDYPAAPNSAATLKFNGAAMYWEDPRTLVEVKAAKNDAINRARAVANSSTFTFLGKQVAVDQLSRSDIDAAHGAILMLQALPPGWPGAWKATDNTYVLIPDVATWAQFYGTMVATGTANFNHSQTIKAQLAAATTIPEVEALANW